MKKIIKYEDIKTNKQFWTFSENWYQRSHNLRYVWQNENESTEYQMKALRIWNIMLQRMLCLSQIASNMQQIKQSKTFTKGGVIATPKINK